MTICTVDTDVVVMAVSSFSKINPDELWVALGIGSRFMNIAIHELVATMNPRQCSTLPIFYTVMGYNTVSAFAGRGKKTFPELSH